MEENKESHRFELKPAGIEGLMFITLIVVILLAGLIFIATDYGSKWFYMSIPFAVLLGLWLILYLPYKLYLHLITSIDTITFDEKGICIQNKKVEIIEYHSWSNITDLFVNKEDHDKKPEEISFITTDTARTINLKLYNTIFTTTEEIWEKITNIYELYNESDSYNN
ncbi:MAG: hypothetical protein FK730_08590 [Asgard group archaeon]|nr:hypothetical protein [Asgard group archaeon]